MRASRELVIRNALVHDGTGARPIGADVAVRGGRIAATGAPGSLDARAFADRVLLDPARALDAGTCEGPHRPAHGIALAFVNSAPVVRESAPTGSRPGRVLRRAD